MQRDEESVGEDEIDASEEEVIQLLAGSSKTSHRRRVQELINIESCDDDR